jgi:hypothetical protein
MGIAWNFQEMKKCEQEATVYTRITHQLLKRIWNSKLWESLYFPLRIQIEIDLNFFDCLEMDEPRGLMHD